MGRILAPSFQDVEERRFTSRTSWGILSDSLQKVPLVHHYRAPQSYISGYGIRNSSDHERSFGFLDPSITLCIKCDYVEVRIDPVGQCQEKNNNSPCLLHYGFEMNFRSKGMSQLGLCFL